MSSESLGARRRPLGTSLLVKMHGDLQDPRTTGRLKLPSIVVVHNEPLIAERDM
jgi:hypothetical protein